MSERTYTAKSLEDIARALDDKAAGAKARGDSQTVIREQRYYYGQSSAFADAAQLVRDSRFLADFLESEAKAKGAA